MNRADDPSLLDHDAHVLAWLCADCCPCGTILKPGEKECAACYVEREPVVSLFEWCGR